MKTQNWITENEHLFEGIEHGIIYVVFKNEKLITVEEAGEPEYKYIYTGKKGKKRGTTIRVSRKGNKFITKIAICEECGVKKAGRKLRKSTCSKCLHSCRSQKMVNRYYKNKPPVKKGITPKQAWYNNLIPGIIYCVFEGNEVRKLKDVQHLFKAGRKKLSPFTGSHYVGRICTCKKCGKRRFSRVRLGDHCKKCQNGCNTKRSHTKKKTKSAKEIAFSITGYYERVESIIYIPEIFDGIDLSMKTGGKLKCLKVKS